MKNKKPIDSLFKAFDILTMKSKLTFGKYKRKTMEYIIETDPNYIVWLAENTNQIIDKKVVGAACRKILSAPTVDEVEADLSFDFEEPF